MDMSEFNKHFGKSVNENIALEQDARIKDPDLEVFKRESSQKNAETLALELNSLQRQLEASLQSNPDMSFDLKDPSFGIQTEGVHNEKILEAKIKILEELIAAEKKYTLH